MPQSVVSFPRIQLFLQITEMNNMPYLKMINKTLMIKYKENPTLFQKSSSNLPLKGGNDPVPFLYNFKSRYNKMCMGMRLIKSQVETSQ